MDILTIVKTKWRALWKQDAMQPPLRQVYIPSCWPSDLPDIKVEYTITTNAQGDDYTWINSGDMYSDSVLEMIANENESPV